MRADLFSKCRSMRGPVGQGSQLGTEAVPQMTMRAPLLMRCTTASEIAPEVLS
jgi:hypothetical protein